MTDNDDTVISGRFANPNIEQLKRIRDGVNKSIEQLTLNEEERLRSESDGTDKVSEDKATDIAGLTNRGYNGVYSGNWFLPSGKKKE